jgi:NitT/TauT family transport system permease protein
MIKYTKYLGILLYPILWEFFSRILNNFYMPSVTKIVIDCYNALNFNIVISTIFVSLVGAIISFLIGNILGFVAGVVFSSSKFLIDITEFSVEFMRSLPSITIFPLFMIMFGINQFSKISVISFGIFWIVMFSVINSVKTISDVKVQYLKIHGANEYDIFRHYIFFVMYKNWVTMLGVTLSLSLFITLSVEMFVGSDTGIGKAIIDSKNYFEISQMYFWIAITGVIGYLLNKTMVQLTKLFG